MRTPYLDAHNRLSTTDLDEAREYVGRIWEPHRSVLRGRSYCLRWNQVDLKNVSLAYLHTSSSLRVDCGPVRDMYRLTMPEAGRAIHVIDGAAVETTARHGAIYQPGQELRLEVSPYRSLLLSFPASYVAKRRRYWTVLSRPARPIGPVPLAAAPVASLRSLSRWLGRELDRPDTEFLRSPRVVAGVERAMVSLFLNSIEHMCPDAADSRTDVGAARLRRIEEWIDDHFAEPIGVEDMANIGDFSVRALQTTFRRLRGYSPTEALLRRRMRAAREALLNATAATTVTGVALDVGFIHFSRFAMRYAQVHGERPSDTLNRSRRRMD